VSGDQYLTRRGFLFAATSLLRARGDETTFSTDVKVVNVLATARTKQGQIAGDLTRDDFILTEDGRPQTIRYFSRETDLPLTIGLMVDTSMSQRRVLGMERDASYRFLDQVLREDKDLAFVIHFDREVELLQDLTPSLQRLQAALGNLATPGGGRWGGRGGGGTMLYDSVLVASDELMKKQAGRKALIMLTDGVDNGSKVPLKEAIAAAQRADTLVYSVLFADEQGYGGGYYPRGGRRGGMSRMPPARPDGTRVLERLSRETGGGFFTVSRKNPIDRIFLRIEEDLRNQYSLGYTSDKAATDGEFRKIRVTAKRKGLIVQASGGYYAAR
jgi:VWFA-related protein